MDASSLEVLLMVRLRILVVLPIYGGSLPIGRYCAQALRELGHSVRVFDVSQLYSSYQAIRDLDVQPAGQVTIIKSFLRFVSQAAWIQAEEQKPQIVLALAQAPLDRHVLLRMRQSGMRTVMWFVEDRQVLNYWETVAPQYDAFAVIQKEPFLEELARIGQKHAFYLPLAALPDFHKPLKLDSKEKKVYGSAISFLGAGYPNRRLAFRPLADRDFRIWGSDWEDEPVLAANIQRNGARIGEEESVKIYNSALINLNLHSSLQTDRLVSGGDFVNPRTFELAAMGAFQLVDERALMPELFAENELATFRTEQELYEKIDYFLAHPEEREAYAQRARERTLRDHTYQQRMITLVDYMERNFGPWPEAENKQPDLEPEIAEKVAALAARLGLAPDASFDDIVARLRRQTGKLDELETAILFLDEWRRQYNK